MTLDQLIAHVKERLREAAPLTKVPHRVSLFLRPIRKTPDGEESTGLLKRLLIRVTSAEELYEQVAENVLLYTLGDAETLFQDLPNVELRLLGERATVPLPGSPPLDRADQIWLKVTVYEYLPTLWEQMFPGKKAE